MGLRGGLHIRFVSAYRWHRRTHSYLDLIAGVSGDIARMEKKAVKHAAGKKTAAKASSTQPRNRAQHRVPLTSDDTVQHPLHIPVATWQVFLDALSDLGHVTNACARAGIKRGAVYGRRDTDEEFEVLFLKAHKQGLARLEDIAVHRATEGHKREVYQQGELVGYETVVSDSLIQFLLSGNDPKYKRKQEITGVNGGPLAVLVQLTDDELDAQIEKLRKDSSEVRGE